MNANPLLLVPGPTPCPPTVLRAMSRQMINHRGPEYAELQREVCEGLRQAFRTEQPVLIFPASGTGGLEAAIVNVLSPGDAVLAVSIGAFGDRFAAIASAHGARVTRLRGDDGASADVHAIVEMLKGDGEIRALLVTHNETSTGVLNDIRAVAAAARAVRPDLLILVDSISGLLTAELQPDSWDLDIVVGGSQKAWMTPPGLTFVSVSERALAAHREARMSRFYFDFTRMLKAMEVHQTPYTPAVSQLFGLREALRLILAEGVEASIVRHGRLARATRAGVRALGLALLADEARASNSVTAICVPEGVRETELRRLLREEHGVEIAGGQGDLRGKVVRIGHLGFVSEDDILAALGALERTLADLGWSTPTAGAATAAAQAVLAG